MDIPGCPSGLFLCSPVDFCHLPRSPGITTQLSSRRTVPGYNTTRTQIEETEDPMVFEQQTSGKKNNNTMGRPLFTPQWRTQQRYVYTPPSCGIWESYLSTGVEDNWCRALPISEFSAPEPRPPRKPSEARRQVLASESSAGAHRPTSEPSEARRARRLAGPQLEQHRPTSKPSEEKEFATIPLLGGISPSNCAPLSREDAPRATARPFAREIAINKLKEKLMPD
jgi:hypothetical protein